ncbi:MAG: HD domain-containing protein [Chloroflexi bacterium]|nr:HD domain-containing protein [Chloroflexota bacterium]
MEVRDPLYGLVEYGTDEEKIINSIVLQRLRNIKQLALASAVYPGAHHSRFEHSIGTMHLAGMVAKRLGLEAERPVLRLAGLLHDVGHGPFSHVSEQVMEGYASDIMAKYHADGVHELISMMLIERLGSLAGVTLESGVTSGICELLKKQPRRSLQQGIISGPLDVDKLDYLRRDSYFAGVQYGAFDLDKVIHSLTRIRISSEEEQLGFHEEGVHAVEQLLLAKYHMNVQVYQHRIRRITDAMLVSGIRFALEEGVGEVQRLFTVEDSDAYLQYYISNNDNTLMDTVLQKGKEGSRELFQRIKERKLLKQVFSLEISRDNFPDAVQMDNILRLSDAQLHQIAQRAVELYSATDSRLDPNLVIVDKQTISNPTFKSPQTSIDQGTIMVKTKSGQRKAFPDISTIFRNPSIDPKVEVLYVYLPLDWLGSKGDRDAFINQRYDTMAEQVMEVVK